MKKIIEGSSQKDKFLAVLEEMRDSIGVIAEGHSTLNKKIDDFKDEMTEFKDEMIGFRDEMYEFKRDTESSFKSIFECLSRIDDEIQDIKKELKERKKQDNFNKDWMTSVEKRISIIEKQLKIQKNAA